MTKETAAAAATAATAAATAASAALALAEKTHQTAQALADAKVQTDIKTAEMAVDISYIKKDIGEIKETLKTSSLSFVNNTDFKEHQIKDDDHETRLRILEKESEDHVLVKRVVYGAVSLVLISVFSAIIYLVVKK